MPTPARPTPKAYHEANRECKRNRAGAVKTPDAGGQGRPDRIPHGEQSDARLVLFDHQVPHREAETLVGQAVPGPHLARVSFDLSVGSTSPPPSSTRTAPRAYASSRAFRRTARWRFRTRRNRMNPETAIQITATPSAMW